jgi:hypothetical protein
VSPKPGAGQDDGTSGLRDAADATLRQEVEKLAHVIFASSAAQRDFWLGRGNASVEELRRAYGGLKPCQHGSDAHSSKDAGAPAENRYSWIKGDPIFDALRQAVIDPESRAYVGEDPPVSLLPSQVIARVQVNGAAWAKTPVLHLNPGLVAIVGARGSGKTALADIVAAGCDALSKAGNKQSFLFRAQEFLSGASVTLTWETGESQTRALDGEGDLEPDMYPRVRYLSQQFVEHLCGADGITDALLREIERVVFDAHTGADRDGAVNFNDLLELRAARHREARTREEQALSVISERIGTELEKIKLVAAYRQQVAEKKLLIGRHGEDRSKLIGKGSEARVARLATVTQAAEKVRSQVRQFNLQEQHLLTMQDEVRDLRQNKAPEALRALQVRHTDSGIKGDNWKPFLIDYKGPVDQVVSERLKATQRDRAARKGMPQPPQAKPDVSLIPADAKLEELQLSLLEAEIARLERLVSIDRNTADRFSALSKRIVEESEQLERLTAKLLDAEGAQARAADMVVEREASYVRVFESIIAEQTVLTNLYTPIRVKLAAGSETLQKLSFSVARVADVAAWADAGESLLDLRRQGPFKGKGTLRQAAGATLNVPWETGTAIEIGAAMRAFREAYQDQLLAHAPFARSQQAEYRAWSRQFAQWLYGTDHIKVHYGVSYGGVDIRNLSPGTRGIVLLLLYLALDNADDRPLIIDQPEESLDPKSIFDELVGHFLAAKSKRQVIMVTHNANLVVNTDADQIIVASAGPQVAGALPPITYLSGGLESAAIRKVVCDILEGGEDAFRERARRLRVTLDR